MTNNYLKIIAAMEGKSICVIGDMVLDKYTNGRISRISREAPVLVLDYTGEKHVAGGAANVVHNVATLGGAVLAVGVLGADADAANLKEILANASAQTDGLIEDSTRFTVSKNRIIAGGRATVSQQIVRLDKENRQPISVSTEEKILAYLKNALQSVNGIVLSDYGAGTLTDNIVHFVADEAHHYGVPIIVDSRYDIDRFKNVDYIKQNDAELAAAVGHELTTEDDIKQAGDELLHKLDAKGILVTRGEYGMLLLLSNGSSYSIPVSDRSEVYDVSGAGDTCVATFILALTAGADPADAARLSNIAAGIAVRKLGTATVSALELQRVAI